MAGNKSNLYRRVEMLLNEKFQLAGFSRWKVLTSLIAIMLVASLSLASVQLVKAAADSEPGMAIENRQDDQTQQEEEKPNL